VVFIPKCRRKTLYKELRRYLGEVLRRLAVQKESRIERRGTCRVFSFVPFSAYAQQHKKKGLVAERESAPET
jgi:hypothetical protein